MSLLHLAQLALEWTAWSSAGAVLLIALVLAAQWLAGRRISARWRYNLWLVVIARLLMPPLATVSIPSLLQFTLDEKRSKSPSAVATSSSVPGHGQEITRETPPQITIVEPRLDPQAASDAVEGPPPLEKSVSRAITPALLTPADDAPQFDTSATANISSSSALLAQAPARQPSLDDRFLTIVERPDTSLARPHSAPALPQLNVPTLRYFWARVPWHMLIVPVWLAGMILVGFRYLYVTLRLANLTRRLRRVDDSSLLRQLDECCRIAGVKQAPILLVGPEGSGPALVGALRPLLLAPPCVLREFAERDLQLIFLHELNHLRRRDVMISYLCSLVAIIHWFNPLVWFALGRMRCDRELACDEAVLRLDCRQGPRAYGSLIVNLLERVSGRSEIVGAMGVVQHRSFMHRRIVMIARFDGTSRRCSATGVVLSLLLGGAATVSTLRAQPAPAVDAAPAPAASSDAAPAPAASSDAASAPEPVPAPTPASPAEEDTVSQARHNVDSVAAGSSAAPDAGPVPPGAEPPAAGTPPLPPPAPEAPGAAPGAEPPGPSIALPGDDSGSRDESRDRIRSRRRDSSAGGGSAPEQPDSLPRQPEGFPGGRGSVRASGGYYSRTPAPRMERPGAMGSGGRGPVGMGSGGMGMASMAGQRRESRILSVEDSAEAAADDRTAEKLQSPVTLSVEKQPLEKVLDSLAQQAGVDLIVDGQAVRQSGFSVEAEVSLNLRTAQPVGQVLGLVLRVAGGNELNYAIVHGVVVASSRAELSRELVTRAYDISDLGNPEELAETIVRSVAPDSPDPRSMMRVFDGKLLVTTTEPNQRQVVKLLRVLRQKPAGGTRPADIGSRRTSGLPATPSFSVPAPVPVAPPTPLDAAQP
jgi:beta-lactamase regulating signal transducer with metallopeptidase domain